MKVFLTKSHYEVLVLFLILITTHSYLNAQQTNYGTGSGTGGNGVNYGAYAGSLNTGLSNSFIGTHSGYYSTTGTNNSFLGYYSGRLNTTGGFNTFLGSQSGLNNTTGQHNVFIGGQSGLNNNSSYNVFVGGKSGMANTSGENNVFIGRESGGQNASGSSNLALGTKAGYSNSNGASNVFLGFEAGYNETESNKLYIANSNTTNPLIYGDFSTSKVTLNGKVGIGCSNPTADLTVNGKVKIKAIHITQDVPSSDFVFEPNYNLLSLEEVEEFVSENKHLPEVPSAAEFKENGYNIGQMDDLLLRKIEELTLYIISQQKEINRLEEITSNLNN